MDIETVLDPREEADDCTNLPWGDDGGEAATTRNVLRERARLEELLDKGYDRALDIKVT